MPFLPALPRKFHGPSIWALYVIGLCPAVWSFYLGATGGLGINPVKEFEHLLGLWALRFIILTLAVTPLRDLVGINWIRYRRALGLLAFYYVLMHFSVWMLLDLGMDVNAVFADILKRPYITIGMVCLAALVPLAVTSNNYSIRRLGKLWVDMHHLIYPIALGGALHYFLAVKSITSGPFIHIAAIALLLAYRPLRKPILRWKKARKTVDSPQPAHR
jgi:sulfoxide reductase heme-binding subunit YedZ